MIKKADPDGFDTVKNITETTISTIYPHYYPKGAVEFFLHHHSDENIRADIEKGIVYILYDGDDAVGTVTLRENEICRLFVLPTYQRRGYGRMLLDFAESTIRQNYSEIVIDASLPAKAIYLKRGYKEKEYHIIDTPDDHLCYDVMVLECE